MTTSNDPEEIRREIERTRANLSNDVNALADEAKPGNIAKRQGEKIKDGARSLRERVMGSNDDDYYGDAPALGNREGNYTQGGYAQYGYADNTGPGVGERAADMRDNAVQRGQQARDAAMERGQQAKDVAMQRGQQAKEAVQAAPGQLRQRTRGNPLAAGLIAFGFGALVGGMLPASQVERRTAMDLKDRAQPMVEQAREQAKDVATEVKDNLAQPVQEAVDTVKQSASESAQNVKDHGQSQAQDLKGSAQEAKNNVQEHNKNN